jgi:L-ribulose-5-phosphate 3-epimerase
MRPQVDRRRFLQASGMIVAGTAVSSLVGQTSLAGSAPAAGRIKKAVCWEMIQGKLSVEDRFRVAKDVGFEGVEVTAHKVKDPKELARASEKVGVPIHGVSNGGHLDLVGAIDEAAIYGANTVLHVVRADPVGSFFENYRRTQELIRGAIPLAEKKKIPILVENVWATFLIEPMTMARYVDEFKSPWVQAYFDVGNVMRWGCPQHWIEVLGKRIGKIHIKEYSVKVAMKDGMSKAFDMPIGQGDIDWPRVRKELAAIGFHSWATAEVRGGDRQHLADVSQQMSKVLGL